MSAVISGYILIGLGETHIDLSFLPSQSLKSHGYVEEKFSWQHYYWYLTNDGKHSYYMVSSMNGQDEVNPVF